MSGSIQDWMPFVGFIGVVVVAVGHLMKAHSDAKGFGEKIAGNRAYYEAEIKALDARSQKRFDDARELVAAADRNSQLRAAEGRGHIDDVDKRCQQRAADIRLVITDLETHLREKITEVETRFMTKITKNGDLLADLQVSQSEQTTNIAHVVKAVDLLVERFNTIETRLHGGASEFSALRERLDGVRDRLTAIEVDRARKWATEK